MYQNKVSIEWSNSPMKKLDNLSEIKGVDIPKIYVSPFLSKRSKYETVLPE